MSTEQLIGMKTDPCHPDAGLFRDAERELSAFLSAVTEVHGPQCVSTAASHWMRALDDVCLSNSASGECFRKVTLAAAVSLSHIKTYVNAKQNAQRRVAHEAGELVASLS
jgi:hypothetical protein